MRIQNNSLYQNRLAQSKSRWSAWVSIPESLFKNQLESKTLATNRKTSWKKAGKHTEEKKTRFIFQTKDIIR